MTFAPDPPSLRFNSLSEAAAALRERGFRLSTPRRLILEALFAAEGPVAATWLVRALSIDESSVYRNLEVLESQGIVRHVHLGHGPGLYALLGGDDVEYLYCARCAKVTSVAPARLDAVRHEIARQFGYATRFTHFAIVGVCEACAARPPENPDDRAADEHPTHAHAHSHGEFVHSHLEPHAADQA
jgi:Fur family ferric uptake transcriptional regulator